MPRGVCRGLGDIRRGRAAYGDGIRVVAGIQREGLRIERRVGDVASHSE